MITEIMYKYAAELDKKDAAIAGGAGLVPAVPVGLKLRNKLLHNQKMQAATELSPKIDAATAYYQSWKKRFEEFPATNREKYNEVKAKLDALKSSEKRLRSKLTLLNKAKVVGRAAAVAALPAAAYLAYRKLSD